MLSIATSDPKLCATMIIRSLSSARMMVAIGSSGPPTSAIRCGIVGGHHEASPKPSSSLSLLTGTVVAL